MSETVSDILLPSDIDLYVQHLERSHLMDLGTPLWFETHHKLQKLNQQAALEASEMREESVKDAMISYGQVNLLVHEVLCIQVWREKIFKKFLTEKREPKNTFIAYIILYHEITSLSLLQNICYHKEAIVVLEDAVLDLIDYCASEMVRLLSEEPRVSIKPIMELSNLEELDRQNQIIGFNVALSSLTLLRYLTENIEELSVDALSRLYNTHDVPLLLTNLLQMGVWRRYHIRTNILQIYEDNAWKNADKIPGIPKYEAQCWIALRQLLLDAKASQYYEINEFRKLHLVKVQRLLVETTIDQIAPLVDLKLYLTQLSLISGASNIRRPLLMETIPEMKAALMAEGYRKWDKILKKHSKLIFDSDQKTALQIAQKLGDTYSMTDLERVAPAAPICACCGDPAPKRCSKCKEEWYCGRECQVKRWAKHKSVCAQISANQALPVKEV